MWQEIAVIIIALIVVLSIGRKIYAFFKQPNTIANNPCHGCTGCSLKEESEKRGHKPPFREMKSSHNSKPQNSECARNRNFL